ncbi:hypothetical protein C942_02679 [Photobacterium marinum]|uniref:Bacterioferritin comigratory protein n=1 Tax=Photobacterium marinum TaxID=1056511 RepID=L8JE94_9GAMM|nr:hypothetical protein [Photobacterium marinum]ELR67171.1 hypothetical protein C942_02679 [Photobacterium marinum]
MKDATRKALLDALERLVAGNPQNIELRKKAEKGKLKVNYSTVEKEAGKSVGALRNHKDIMELIKQKSLDVRVSKSDTANTQIDVLQAELKKAKEYGTNQAKLKKKHHEQAKRDADSLALQAAKHVKMIEQLMLMIPEEQREAAMDKVVNTHADNVVLLNK